MLNPDEDTEWNDILRQKGILPPKKVEKEPEVEPVDPVEKLSKLSLNHLQAKQERHEDRGSDTDDSDEFLAEYRQKRMDQLKAQAARPSFYSYGRITKADWVDEVNNAPKGVYVVIHIAESGDENCNIIDNIMKEFVLKYPHVKFLRAEAVTCIPNYPSSNIPTLFVYKDSVLEHKLIGLAAFGGKKSLTPKDLELKLSSFGVIYLDNSLDESDANKHKKGFVLRRNKSDSDSESD
ncbi:Phosducin-like protein 3 [Cichlidogyrus casuarinus]|uniref:Phosducin-like protein 3 n=1 Tax=Cichlidogyrus casuarinus TaxID=1844966 RepID=A0ABD2PNT0_9PLAT